MPTSSCSSPSAYGYTPSLAAGIIFSIGFGLSAIAHIVQTIVIAVPNADRKSSRRFWWTLLFAAGAACECIGWSGRAYNAQCPGDMGVFVMQGSTDIIAPLFFMAGLYVSFAHLLQQTGTASSRYPHWLFPVVFSTLNVAAMLLQGLGDAAFNARAIEGGALMQLISFGLFTLFFLTTISKNVILYTIQGTSQTVVLISTGTVLILFWAVYQAITGVQGLGGYVNTHEGFVIGLDATPMLVLTLLFNVAHPAWIWRGMISYDVSGQKEQTKEVEDPDYV